MQEPRRPEVVLLRSSAPVAVEPAALPAPPRRAWWLLSLTAFGLLLAGTSTGVEPPSAPAPPLVDLVVLERAIAVSQGGVLVVPLELRNLDRAAVTVDLAEVYAEPVRQDARVPAPRLVPGAGTRGLVAVIAPDCRLLRAGWIAFRATVRVRVGRPGTSQDLHLDLAADPAVRRTVTGVCG